MEKTLRMNSMSIELPIDFLRPYLNPQLFDSDPLSPVLTEAEDIIATAISTVLDWKHSVMPSYALTEYITEMLRKAFSTPVDPQSSLASRLKTVVSQVIVDKFSSKTMKLPPLS